MKNKINELLGQLRKIVNIEGHIDTDAASNRIRSAIPFRGPNVWILACSIMIASAGLNINSTAVIIGAMLISPLMGPIIGIGLALGTSDTLLLKFSLKNLLIMMVVSLIFSTLFYLVSPLSLANPTELEARTAPTIYDVLIALFGGAAGILENSRKERGMVLSGVAIATALMPPLCTAGYGIARLSGRFFFGAMFLFVINCVFIILATFLMVRYLKFRPVGGEDERISRKGKRLASAILTLVLIPSIIAAFQLVRDNNFERHVEDFVRSHTILGGSYIYDHHIGPKRTVTISIAGDPMTDEEWVAFWEDARKSGLKKEQVTLRQNTRTMTKDQMLLLMHDLHAQTDLALGEKDKQIQALERSLDSLRRAVQDVKEQQDSLAAAAARDSLQAPAGMATNK